MPLSRGHVTWRLQPLNGLDNLTAPPGLEAYSFGGASSDIDETEGTGALVDGVFRARVPADDADDEIGGMYALAGEVVDDASSQAVSFSHRLPIRPDVMVIGLAPPEAPIRPGQPVALRVVAIDRQGRLVAGVPVQVTVPIGEPHGSKYQWVHAVTGLEPVGVEIPARDWPSAFSAIARGTDPSRWVMGASAYIPRHACQQVDREREDAASHVDAGQAAVPPRRSRPPRRVRLVAARHRAGHRGSRRPDGGARARPARRHARRSRSPWTRAPPAG